MEEIKLHPWVSNPDAYTAALRAVQIPIALAPEEALGVGQEELLQRALAILTQCALPPRGRLHTKCANCQKALDGISAGAIFCSRQCRREYRIVGYGALAPSKAVYVGSMWSWPEDDMMSAAVRTIGYALNHWLRRRAAA